MKNETVIERPAEEIQLKKLIENIERLEEEKSKVSYDISEVYKEAKSQGFSPKIMKKLVAIRKRNREELQEENYLLQTYANAIQMELF